MAGTAWSSESRQAGAWWLSECSVTPAAARAAWEREELAPIPSNDQWRAIEAPLIRSVNAMQRIGYDRLGPILAAPGAGLVWWLVKAGEAEQLDDLRHLIVRPAGWRLLCPSPTRSAGGRIWLEAPDGTGRLTDAALLGAAVGPAGAGAL